MRNLIYIIAIALIIGWSVGYFVFGVNGMIHAILILAIVATLVNVVSQARPNVR
jgi:predicted PurR-regulated permease PerM